MMNHILSKFKRPNVDGLESPLDYSAEEYVKDKKYSRQALFNRLEKLTSTNLNGTFPSTMALHKYLKKLTSSDKKDEGDGGTKSKYIPFEIEPLLYALDTCASVKSVIGKKGPTRLTGMMRSFYLSLHKSDDPLFSVHRNNDKAYQQVITLDYGTRLLGERISQLLAIVVLCNPELRPGILCTTVQQLDVIITDFFEKTSLLYDDSKIESNPFKDLLCKLYTYNDFIRSANNLYENLVKDRDEIKSLKEIPPGVISAVEKACAKKISSNIRAEQLSIARKAYSDYRAKSQKKRYQETSKVFHNEIQMLEKLLLCNREFSDDEERNFLKQHFFTHLWIAV